MSALGRFGRFTLFSPRVSHSKHLPCSFCFVLCFGFGVFVALLCFCFLFCKCFGIPNSPRSLDLDDRQGLIASSAMQQKKNPSLQAIEELKRAFTLWERQPTLCTIMAVLIAGSNLKKESSWPLGHVVLLPGQDAPQLCYIGDETPKLLLLVNAARPQVPETYVVEATAFPSAELFVACQRAWPYPQLQADPEYNVELRDGQAILNIGGYHCQ